MTKRTTSQSPAARLFATRCLALLATVTLVAGAARDAAGQASVVSIGDVSPAERPFIPGDQGIPVTGSTVFTTSVDFDGNPVDDFGFPFVDEDGNTVGQFNYERSANIEIGRYATGQMLMSGGAALRFGDLIIGGDTNINDQANNLDVVNGDFGIGLSSGSGTVELAGDRTLYNNHPRVVETQYQQPTNPEATTFIVPEFYNPNFELGGIDGPLDTVGPIARPGTINGPGGAPVADVGGEFDLYVGLTGSGVLNIVEGARAEIRDGAFVGVAPDAVGRISVDGPRSYLGIYGMLDPFSTTPPPSDAEQTLIGLYGDGTLQISNGGRVDSFNRAALGAGGADGDRNDRDQDLVGGHGTAVVEGPGSVWRIFVEEGAQENDDDASGLSVGEFFDVGVLAARTDLLFLSSPIGGLNPYEPSDGSGNLVVRNGGLVTVHELELDDDDDAAAMRIGARGIVELAGGRIVVGDRLDNDGVIKTGYDAGLGDEQQGNGEIDTGVFLNSAIGQVRVGAGERLLIRSTEGTGGLIGTPGKIFTAGTTAETYFYANAGKIEVLGNVGQERAEIEFARAFNDVEDRFKNFFAADVPTGDPTMLGTFDLRAQIKAQEATLYFRSGLENQADVDFVGGDNIVVGDVDNTLTGRVRIINESHVTFQDNLNNDGLILLNNNSTFAVSRNFTGTGVVVDLNPVRITIGGNYDYDGDLEFTIQSIPGGFEHTSLDIAGDAIFGPNSTLSIGGTLIGLTVGDSFDLINVVGSVIDNGLTITGLPTIPIGLTPVLDTDLTDGVYTLSFDLLDPAIVGADFNGDGVVDINDRLIWQMNNGLASGATGALGDVDGDGDVDARDGFLLNQQLATGIPVPGAGAGSGAVGVVPEPTAAMLLLLGLAGLIGRRRAA